MRSLLLPSLEEVIYLHEVLIHKYGGDYGIRDKGLIESALARVRSGYYETLSEQAAALLQSFVVNHCFVDRNKRIAFSVAAVFLKMNGYSLKVSAEEAEHFIVPDLIENHAQMDEIEKWISLHVKV